MAPVTFAQPVDIFKWRKYSTSFTWMKETSLVNKPKERPTRRQINVLKVWLIPRPHNRSPEWTDVVQCHQLSCWRITTPARTSLFPQTHHFFFRECIRNPQCFQNPHVRIKLRTTCTREWSIFGPIICHPSLSREFESVLYRKIVILPFWNCNQLLRSNLVSGHCAWLLSCCYPRLHSTVYEERNEVEKIIICLCYTSRIAKKMNSEKWNNSHLYLSSVSFLSLKINSTFNDTFHLSTVNPNWLNFIVISNVKPTAL